ncbi:MAG: SMP-30/gluconolactonase/LRE family protein [Betaproteobacteria bacterium]|nr:SMP-30/gluconolactonase/LRE family protein [Betaproteobacteria bacterium]
MLRKAATFIAILAVVAITYLTLAPVPVDPVAWQAPPAPGYAGPHASNTRLANLHHLKIGGEIGPEGMASGPDGKLYAAVASGAIVRLNQDGSGFEKWTDTGGRVLGIDFDAQGRLIAADAMRGLLAIGPDGKHELLSDNVDGDPIRYANSVAVSKSGRIYFTDSSRRFGAKDWGGTFNASVHDILEHSATGRLLEYDPATRRTRTVMRDLCFANGVALSADESRIFVAETGEYRVWSIDPAASNMSAKAATGGTPQANILLSNLPGYPDNLTRGGNGRIWLGLAKPRGAAVDKLSGQPFLRKVVMRLPKSLWPIPPAYGHVIAFDERGKIISDLQDPSGSYPETTGVLETADRLYIQSLHAKSLAWLAKADVGLK